jgi:hypothetical protein
MVSKNDDILFNLELQLDENRTAKIIVRENDDVEEVVNKFCEENKFDETVKQVIMDQIVQVLDNNIEERIIFFNFS